ncbi:MAG: hypothetical protein IJI53_02410 [Clostridia bacterium]|nr:hypothetical protein [Clostridia bacterium]MBR0406867.1 hypothetical protein [Clostridia bacterium]
MKIEPAVRAETKKMALGVGALSLLMVAVFLVIGQFDWTVLTGALLGSAAAIGNFFLMALTVQKVTNDMPVLPPREETEPDGEEGEEKEPPLSDEARQMGKKMQLSYTLRMLLMAGVAALAISLPLFHSVASLVPMLFPRVVIALRGLMDSKQKEA